VNVNVDRQTLSQEDLDKVVELLRFRPMQLCIFLKALLGEEAMLRPWAKRLGLRSGKVEWNGHLIFFPSCDTLAVRSSQLLIQPRPMSAKRNITKATPPRMLRTK
jgi:hypothetical protein